MLVDSEDISLRRRDVVCGGGAAVFSAIVAALLGGAKPARAQPISGSVPRSTVSRYVSSSTAIRSRWRPPPRLAMSRFSGLAGALVEASRRARP
jgi:hypothetical protein